MRSDTGCHARGHRLRSRHEKPPRMAGYPRENGGVGGQLLAQSCTGLNAGGRFSTKLATPSLKSASRSDWRMNVSASLVASLIDCESARQTWRFITAIDDGDEFAARSCA